MWLPPTATIVRIFYLDVFNILAAKSKWILYQVTIISLEFFTDIYHFQKLLLELFVESNSFQLPNTISYINCFVIYQFGPICFCVESCCVRLFAR